MSMSFLRVGEWPLVLFVGSTVALLGFLTLLLVATRIVRRALCAVERASFRAAGDRAGWTAQGFAARPGSIGDFAREALNCLTEIDRVDLICERLASVDLETSFIQQRLGMLARCALAVGGSALVGALTCCLRRPSIAAILDGTVLPVLALLLAVHCWRLGRQTRTAIHERRCDWDRFSQVLLSSSAGVADAWSRNEPSGVLRVTGEVGKHRGKSRAYSANPRSDDETHCRTSKQIPVFSREKGMNGDCTSSVGFVLLAGLAFIEDRI